MAENEFGDVDAFDFVDLDGDTDAVVVDGDGVGFAVDGDFEGVHVRIARFVIS